MNKRKPESPQQADSRRKRNRERYRELGPRWHRLSAEQKSKISLRARTRRFRQKYGEFAECRALYWELAALLGRLSPGYYDRMKLRGYYDRREFRENRAAYMRMWRGLRAEKRRIGKCHNQQKV